MCGCSYSSYLAVKLYVLSKYLNYDFSLLQIYLELERARVTRKLAEIKEADGEVSGLTIYIDFIINSSVFNMAGDI